MARTAPAAAAVKLPLERARAFWHRRQGLAEPGKGNLEEFLAATSWPRTLGGVDVYLAVRARMPGMRRQEMDEAVAHANAEAEPGDTVLLAPAAASFDQYPNFEKRGEHFTALVRDLQMESARRDSGK